MSGCGGVPADLQHVTRANVAVQWFGSQDRPDSPPIVPADLDWRVDPLPDVRHPTEPFVAGHRSKARMWVRFTPDRQFTIDSPGALTYSAFLPTGSHAVLYVDGRQVSTTDRTLSNGWNAPVLMPIPMSIGASAPVTLTIAFDCTVGQLGCGVPSFYVGSLSAATKRYELHRALRIDVPRVGSVAILLVGLFSLAFWMRRRQESEYALFAVASVIWVVRSLHYHLPHYPQPIEWFWWLTLSSLSWLAVTMYLFAFRLHAQHRPNIERMLFAAAALATLFGIPPLTYDAWIYQRLSFGLQVLLSLAVTILLTTAALRLRTREHIAMAVALWISLFLGIHDALLHGWQIGMERVFLLPYAAAPLFGAFLYAMARRYRAAISDAETLNASLEARLAERQQELATSYAKLRDYEVQNAQIEERQRLMRDMHDGLGSSLMSSLAICERGEADPALMVNTLREAVDDLRLTIDSLEPIEHDLVTLLATLRYRLEPRLEKAGLKVDWRVEDVPAIEWLDASAALQILRIVQESITNVLKHANATCLRVATEVNSHVVVTIADDGVGFDVIGRERTGHGRGLRNLRQRASRLGGVVTIHSGAKGTTVTLQLPLERSTAAAPV
jgi:signal transduction histidine kinase